MKIFYVDISGRVTKYNDALCKELCEASHGENELYFFSSDTICTEEGLKRVKMLSLIPKQYKSSHSFLKRIIKVVEIIANYFLLLGYLWKEKVDIIHFQWLPLMDYIGLESFILKVIILIAPRTRIILTIHNVYPHNITPKSKILYKKRFVKVSRFINSYIVHTNATKKEVVENFGIKENDIYVVHHGVFIPKILDVKENKRNDKIMRFIMYGNQGHYKGTDILVDAALMLPESYKSKSEFKIVGNISPVFYNELKNKTDKDSVKVDWMPYFVDDKMLYQEIIDSDVIVLPYRAISQSGVLLLALYFEKLIITSDLVSFKETLDTFTDDMFFKNENIKDLSELLKRYINHEMNFDIIKGQIRALKEKYTWNTAAIKTISIYNSEKSDIII